VLGAGVEPEHRHDELARLGLTTAVRGLGCPHVRRHTHTIVGLNEIPVDIVID